MTAQTYHCICTTLLLATTHTLSSLPRRSTASSGLGLGLDAAIILPLPLPLPSAPPSPLSTPLSTPLSNLSHPSTDSPPADLPSEGYTILLGLTHDQKPTLIRRQDGFEKRNLYRCSRCRVVVAYEIATVKALGAGEEMEIDGGRGKEKEGEGEYKGKVLYVLNGGLMSTDVMMKGRKIGEEDVEIGKNGVAVFE